MVTHLASKYAEQAVQYYIAARYSALAGLSLVAGVLYHHAVEMMLKARLSEKHTTEELESWGHNLQELWRVYLTERGNNTLRQFYGTIQQLNAFEKIRFPEKMVQEGADISFSMAKGQRPKLIGRCEAPRVPSYHFAIQELDSLMSELIASSSLNPAILLPSMRWGTDEFFYRDNLSFQKT